MWHNDHSHNTTHGAKMAMVTHMWCNDSNCACNTHAVQQLRPHHHRSTTTAPITPTQHNDHNCNTTHGATMAPATPIWCNNHDCDTTCSTKTVMVTTTPHTVQ